MSTNVSYKKGGITISCDTSLYPAPEPQAAWPVPIFPPKGGSPITAVTVAITGQGAQGILVSSQGPLPAPAATWTLYDQSWQGSTPATLPTPVAIPVALVNGVLSYTIAQPLAGATHVLWLVSNDNGTVTTYPSTTVTTPADPTQSSISSAASTAAAAAAAVAALEPFGASGSSHASGLVPDPGSTAGTTRYLREDGGWASLAYQGSSGLPTYTVFDPDRPPASPSAYDDEFNTAGAVGGIWTKVNWGAVTSDVNTTLPGRLYASSPSNTGTMYALLQSIPAGDFSIWTKVNIEAIATNYVQAGLVLSDTNTAGTGHQVNNNLSYSAASYGWQSQVDYITNFNTYNSDYAAITAGRANTIYLRIRRVGTTYYRACSSDGVNWFEEQITLTFTPLYMGIHSMPTYAVAPGYPISTSFEFFRYQASATAQLGGIRTIYGG